MIEVTMGVDYAGDAQAEPGNGSDNLIGIPAGIDHHTIFGLLTAKNEAVYLQWSDYYGFEYHRLSVMCIRYS